MEAVKNLFDRIVREEDGQGMIEYALLAALLSIAAIAIILALGPQISGVFSDVQTALPTT